MSSRSASKRHHADDAVASSAVRSVTTTTGMPNSGSPRDRSDTPNIGPSMTDDGEPGTRGSASTPRRLLIVEDDLLLCKAYERVFRDRPETLMVVHTVADATSALDNGVFEVLLCDFRLPDGVGTEVIRHANSLARVPRTVAITGEARPTEMLEMTNAGALVCLTKPVEAKELLQAIRAACALVPDLTSRIAAQLGERLIADVQASVLRVMVQQAAAETQGNRSQMAERLGVPRPQLQRWVRRILSLSGDLPGTDKPRGRRRQT